MTRRRESRLEAAGPFLAGRDLRPLDPIVDLVTSYDDHDEPLSTARVVRTVAEPIPQGTALRVGDDGRVYGRPAL